MQNKRNFDIIGATILLGGLVFAFAHMPRKAEAQKPQENQGPSTTIALDKLKLDRDSLNEVAREYKDKKTYYSDQQAVYKNVCKTYDNMDSLYLLSRKLYITMDSRYSVMQQEFEKKIAKIGRRFCKKNGKYNFTKTNRDGTESRVAWTPVGVPDWLLVLEENKDKIPNYVQIQYENTVLDNMGGTLYEFSEFLKNDFRQYVKTSKAQKTKDKKTIVLSFDATNQSKMNTADNVNQDKILNALINDYMNRFIIFDNYQQLIDEKLYKDIMQIALSIKAHNDIESEAITSAEEYAKTIQALDSVKNEIKELKKIR